ncbi:Plant organelle RNA recognition domain - like 10 [Theobroma cacao]|nr:Plant organelle RNA recognition domain - like 10 [Theobroma cacao]
MRGVVKGMAETTLYFTLLDPRTGVSEKRIHELLHLRTEKKTIRQNVSNLRKLLSLPQKFTKVFERHPGIVYISKMCDTQTVVLREAYDCQRHIQRHPLVDIRERFASMMRKGFMDRSRGLYKQTANVGLEDPSKIVLKLVEMGLVLKWSQIVIYFPNMILMTQLIALPEFLLKKCQDSGAEKLDWVLHTQYGVSGILSDSFTGLYVPSLVQKCP